MATGRRSFFEWLRTDSFGKWLRTDDSPRGDLVRALLLYLATRAALAVFVWLTGQHYTCVGHRCTDRAFFPHSFLFNGLFQWDAYQYAQLARRGYYIGEGFDTNAPFFPGFPVLARMVGVLFHSTLVGGIVLNHVASIAAAFLLARVVRLLRVADPHGNVDAAAREATLFWLASPLTIFFCVFLSESLFGLASVALIWAVVSGRWPAALAAGIVVSATRVSGVFVIGAAIVLAWERRHAMRVGALGWICLLLTPIGLAAMMMWQSIQLHDALAWMHVQRRWNRYLVPPWRTLHDDWLGLPRLDSRNVDAMYRTQELLAMFLVTPLFFLRRRFRIPWGLWLLGLCEWLLALMNHSLISCARYQAANVYFALAIPALLEPRPMLRGVVYVLFGMVLAWYASTYPFGNWAS